MSRLILIGAALAVATLTAACAQAPAVPAVPAAAAAQASPQLTVHPLRGDVYWVSGGVANSGFIVGEKGVIVIDAQMFMPEARAALAEIARRTTKPVSQIILTHSDPDHVLGLPAFAAGTPIIAHAHTRADMLAAGQGPNARPAAKLLMDFLPTRLIGHREELVLEGVQLSLFNTAGAHTDGDLAVYLPRQKIVFAGDLISPAIGAYPGIHLCKRGSSQGWIASAEALLALDADLFVSGHGAPVTRAELQGRIDAARARRAQVADLVKQGKTLAQVKAAVQDVPLPGLASRFPTFAETTYQELSGTAPDCTPPKAPAPTVK